MVCIGIKPISFNYNFEKAIGDIMEFIDQYHKLYEKAKIWEETSWLGEPCWKLPMDAFVMQELIVKLEPDFIIETGTGFGGSAMFYASLCELMGHGEVVTCYIQKRHRIDMSPFSNVTNRIHFISGGSTNPLTLKEIKKIVGDTTDNIVILDSWHTTSHVLIELGMYESLVGKDYYIIVEDTHAGNPGHPVKWEWPDEGPYEAVNFFLKENKDFVVDYSCEKHLMTFNPKGYLRRIN
jgi:cephalosporin hydroxylase